MQSVSSWIWTRIVEFISYDDNHYTTGILYIYWHDNLLLSVFGAWEDIQCHLRESNSHISIHMSIDILTLNKRKERQKIAHIHWTFDTYL